MIQFNKIEQIFKRADYQINFQDLVINGRYHDKIDGWSQCTFTDDLEEQLIDLFMDQIGGWEKSKAAIRRAVEFHKPQHWALSRFFLEERNNKIMLVYCAGQDYPAELAELRRYLKK